MSWMSQMVTSNVLFSLFISNCIILVAWFLLKPKKKEIAPQIPFSCKDQMHWILGHAEMMQDMLVGLHKICVEGSPFDGLSKFNLMGSTAVAVIKAEHVKSVLLASNYRSKIPLIEKHMNMFLGKRALTALMKDEWKIMRKIMARAFNWEYLKETVSDICSVSSVFVQALGNKHGEIVDFWPLMKCITLDVIGKTAFGYDFCCCGTLTSSPIAVSFELLLEQCMTRQFKTTLDPRYYFYNYPNEANKKHAECSAVIRNTLSDIVDKRINLRNSSKNQEHKDLLKYMLDAHAEEKVAADNATLVDNLITILFGGFDTSSITLTYALYMMTQHRDVEAKVVAEVLSVFGKEPKDSTQLLTYENITNNLPYCTAVINEVLRLYPPAPVTVRTLEEPLDLKVDTTPTSSTSNTTKQETIITLPKGIMMYIPIWWIQRSPLNYPDEPDKFDPDRFFIPERAAKIHRFAHVAFSGGARECVGKRFAMLETVGVFALLLRSFTFEADDGYTLETEVMGIVQKPKGNMPLKVFKRS